MVQSVTSSTSSSPSTSGPSQTQRKDFEALQKALKSGNADQAKAAYAQLVKDSPASATSDPNSPLSKLGAQINSGDLTGAEKTLQSFGRGHHARGSSGSTGTSNSAESLNINITLNGTSSTATTSSNPTSSLGNNVDVLA